MYNEAEEGTYGTDFDAFSNKSVRHGSLPHHPNHLTNHPNHLTSIFSTHTGFIRKVYGILSVQVIFPLGYVIALSAR